MASMPEQVDVKVRVEAELSVIRPGDKVLVRVQRDLEPEQARVIAERLRERLPDVEVCVISGVDGIDVYRPDDAVRALTEAALTPDQALAFVNGGGDGGTGTGAEGPGAPPAP